MTNILHLVPRVLFYPQIRDRYRSTMKHFNQAEWRWEDKKGDLHTLRCAIKLEDLFKLRGDRFDRAIMHHFENYDWAEEFGQDVQRHIGVMKVEIDAI